MLSKYAGKLLRKRDVDETLTKFPKELMAVDWDDVISSSFDIFLADALFYFLKLHDPPGTQRMGGLHTKLTDVS